ncbi:hypothetical protein HMPREF0663_11334 [Hoylesella oralis ATCC 33269]|uniref:Uncharacterized protein n=1 Tax=Hoylesella oralis ATCC 33269 TaxID=873533 RepID=E7RQ83_9BACT|nr:hypothetical protein HMPREF0663_11334 [Hoylesella oralis ATCC 33269]
MFICKNILLFRNNKVFARLACVYRALGVSQTDVWFNGLRPCINVE